MLVAVLVAWGMMPFWRPDDPGVAQGLMLASAFLIGIFPDSGITAIQQAVKNASGGLKVAGPNLKEPFPLTELDGVNIYHLSRLMDAGIENLENLAHGDLIELMLDTRIPLGTLVDWIDQAILLLHIKGGDPEQAKTDLNVLRSHGLRTASDVEVARKAAKEMNEDEFLHLLGAPKDVPRLKVILDALWDDEWMEAIRRYREAARQCSIIVTHDMIPAWDKGTLSQEEPPVASNRRTGPAVIPDR